MVTKDKCAYEFLRQIQGMGEKKGQACKTHNSKILGHKNKVTYELHGCPIAKVDKKRRLIKMDTCGYHTKTTKDHLNLVLGTLKTGKTITQKKGEWFINGSKFDNNKFVRY